MKIRIILKENNNNEQEELKSDPFEAFVSEWTNIIEPNVYFECQMWDHGSKGKFPTIWRATSYVERDLDDNYFFMAERQYNEYETNRQQYKLPFYLMEGEGKDNYTWIGTGNIDYELVRVLN